MGKGVRKGKRRDEGEECEKGKECEEGRVRFGGAGQAGNAGSAGLAWGWRSRSPACLIHPVRSLRWRHCPQHRLCPVPDPGRSYSGD